MTKEQKEDLELQKAHAKQRCKETYATIIQLKRILSSYFRDYYRWKRRFEEADRKLAMEEKLKKVSSRERKEKEPQELEIKLTKKQILEIAETLGVKLELNFEDEEVSEDGN